MIKPTYVPFFSWPSLRQLHIFDAKLFGGSLLCQPLGLLPLCRKWFRFEGKNLSRNESFRRQCKVGGKLVHSKRCWCKQIFFTVHMTAEIGQKLMERWCCEWYLNCLFMVHSASSSLILFQCEVIIVPRTINQTLTSSLMNCISPRYYTGSCLGIHSK